MLLTLCLDVLVFSKCFLEIAQSLSERKIFSNGRGTHCSLIWGLLPVCAWVVFTLCMNNANADARRSCSRNSEATRVPEKATRVPVPEKATIVLLLRQLQEVDRVQGSIRTDASLPPLIISICHMLWKDGLAGSPPLIVQLH